MARRRADSWLWEDTSTRNRTASVQYVQGKKYYGQSDPSSRSEPYDPEKEIPRISHYARRRKDNFSTIITIAIFGFVGIWFAGLIWVGMKSMNSYAARRREASTIIITTSTPAPAPALVKNKEKRITNILLLGSDQRNGDNGFRTDVILLVNINQDEGTVKVVSFPRDMWVDAAGFWETKINMVFGMGGFESLAGTFETNFGVKPDYYFLTNFDGFVGVIDSLDGIDVEAAGSLTDDCDLPQQNGEGDCSVEPGTIHMDGATALWYVRSRHTSSDYDRMRRMQEVMAGIFNRLMRMQAMRKIPEMYEQFSSSVETNMGLQDMLPLLQVASAVFSKPERISTYAIAEEYTTEMISWDGMWILLPDLEAIKGMLTEAGVE